MYEAVHAAPDGESTVARMALTAAECGFDGIVVRNHVDARADYDASGIEEAYGVDIVEGIEIRAESPEQASGYLGANREDHVVLAVHGGTKALNRFAVSQDRVDVLSHPTRNGGTVDQVIAREAATHGVHLEFDLSPVLRADGGTRVQALRRLRTMYDLVDHYDVPYVVSADPTSHLQVRAPRELAALGDVIGLGAEFVREGLREWGRLAERNRERLSDEFIEPGVRKGRYDER